MTSPADLSVVIPCYNHGRFLEDCLEAVQRQSLPPGEVIVVDDASTDDTPERLRKLGRRYDNLVVLRNDGNLGVNRAVNRGLQLATGEFVFLHAADDLVRPGFFERSLALLQRHPESALCSSWCSTFVDGSDEIEPNPSGWSDEPRRIPPERLTELTGVTQIPGHASIVRRELLLQEGGFRGEHRWYADWFVYLVLGLRHGICHVPAALSLLRVMPSTYSAGRLVDPAHAAVAKDLLRTASAPRLSDVFPRLVRSGALAHLGPDVIRAIAALQLEGEADWTQTFALLPRRAFRGLMQDGDPNVRRVTVRAMATRGDDGVAMLPWLYEALDDSDAGVRSEARDSLPEIESRVPSPLRAALRLIRSRAGRRIASSVKLSAWPEWFSRVRHRFGRGHTRRAS